MTALNPRIRSWSDQVVWLVGASTGIGRAVAQALHAKGARVIVSARSAQGLEAFTRAHPGSLALPLDVSDRDAMKHAAEAIVTRFGRLDLVLFCAGHYRPMRATELNLDEALKHQQVNVSGAWHLLDAVLPILLKQGHGHLSLVASVAGYRGLPNSLAYGPTKAALQNLADTLYIDLHDHGLGISIVNPGFVATPLTAQNQFNMPALLTPEQAAQAILSGWEKGRFEIHFPRRFTWWLKLMRMLPHSLYFALVKRATGL